MRTAESVCRRSAVVTSFAPQGDDLRVEIAPKDVPRLVSALVRANVRVAMVRPVRSLEEYFLSITEQSSGS
jgi:hypothetical protein